jgi:hypothetical protein
MSNPVSSLGTRRCSLLDHWGLELRIRREYPVCRTFSFWEDVMVLLDSQVLAGLPLMLLSVGVGGSLGGLSCWLARCRRASELTYELSTTSVPNSTPASGTRSHLSSKNRGSLRAQTFLTLLPWSIASCSWISIGNGHVVCSPTAGFTSVGLISMVMLYEVRVKS